MNIIALYEIKNELEHHLIYLLSPCIYDGIEQIYNEAKTSSTERDILKTFQLFLSNIPSWRPKIIQKETKRIINKCKSQDLLDKLLSSIVKITMMTLLCNRKIINDNNNINIESFIHKCYIECAREFYNNPILFNDTFESYDIKRNKRECNFIIRECIKTSIRKIIPLNLVLSEFLNHNMSYVSNDEHIDTLINSVDNTTDSNIDDNLQIEYFGGNKNNDVVNLLESIKSKESKDNKSSSDKHRKSSEKHLVNVNIDNLSP